MHYFTTETATLQVTSVRGLARQAKALYEENLSAYVKLVLRRPFARIIVSDQPSVTFDNLMTVTIA
jgi:exocyst complex component 1